MIDYIDWFAIYNKNNIYIESEENLTFQFLLI